MDEQFQKKILDNILQTGFPLELEIVEKLRSANHLTFPNISFQTEDQAIKELDIVSIITNEETEWDKGPASIQLQIECKKTGKYPWVFFDQGHDPLISMGLLSIADYSTDFYQDNFPMNPLIGCMNTRLAAHHYNNMTIPKARTYFEAFKNSPNEPTAIYKAVMNVFHGRKFLHEWFNNSKEGSGRTMLHQYCVVLDGPLICASREEDSFNLKEVDHLILLGIDTISPGGRELMGNQVVIDVVKKEYFDKYLRMVEKEAREFCYHLKDILAKGLINPVVPAVVYMG